MTKYIAIATIFASVMGCGLTSEGIHIISNNAVYVAGASCTVNMEFDRDEEEIRSEMLECLALHRTYAD